MDILKQLSSIGMMPVVKINDSGKAVALANALRNGGLNGAEITFRTDAAEEAIRSISATFPDMLVGAGTVLTVEQARRALAAGAKFIVSPGFNPKVVTWCLENGVLPLPGCTTPTEIEQAIEFGLNVVKFFPAEQSGGIAKIKAMSAPYAGVKFMPTGGIGLDNMNDYLREKCIIACGGSFMVKESHIDNECWDEITHITRLTIEKMLSLEIDHIGINHEDAKSAAATAEMLSLLTGKGVEKDSEKSMFVASQFELMKLNARGKHGHIAVRTSSVDRAVYHLKARGVCFDEASAVYNEDGSMRFIYLADEYGGFGIHLVQNK